MVIRRRSGDPSLNAPLRIWLLAGVSSLVLATVVVDVTTRTVQADTQLPRPATSVPPSVPVIVNAQPELTPKGKIAAQKKAMLRGIATWYGTVFNGRQTASGE